MFIVFDGIDGAGKTTQLRKISTWLKELNYDHSVFKDPGSTKIGQKIREIFLNNKVDALSALFLLSAARTMLANKIAKYNTNLVICDRYTDSTFAYQGKFLDKKLIEEIVEISILVNKTERVAPDYVFLFLNQYKKKDLNLMDKVASENADYINQVFYERSIDKKNYFIVPEGDIDFQFNFLQAKFKEILCL